MSLSKRDTFVRWVDPLQIIWEDAEGNIHVSISDGLRAFEIPDTPENREKMVEIAKELIVGANPKADIRERLKPDSEKYFEQKFPRCDHKFMGSNTCVKCGWSLEQGGPMGGA